MGWYAVFYREVLLLQKKIGKMGYIFSTVLSPFIYLLSFGLGLGSRVQINGGSYLPFLITGILGMTVIMNAFHQTAMSISGGRLYYRHFQTLVLSPVRAAEVVTGMLLAALLRAAFFGLVVLLVAWMVFGICPLTGWSVVGILLGAFCFGSMGIVAGLAVKQAEDISLITNLFITPMVFFGGSFFPLQNLPAPLAAVASVLPIGSINVLLRTYDGTADVLPAILVLSALTAIFSGWSIYLYAQYSE